MSVLWSSIISAFGKLSAAHNNVHSVSTPDQAFAVSVTLNRRSVMTIVQSGSGNAAAFALPLLQRLIEYRRESAEAMGSHADDGEFCHAC